MKTKASVLLTVIILFTLNSCIPFQVVEGNGELVTKTISIEDYDELEAGYCNMEINYVQSDAEPFLEVTTDANIFEIFEFVVKDNHSLRIRPQTDFRKNTRIKPTKFIVNTNSSVLRDISYAGSGKLNINSKLITDKLEINLAGSGDLHLNDTTILNKLDIEIAGSGNVNVFYVETETFKGSIAGSGDFRLAGSAKNAEVRIAGSGKMTALDFVVGEMTTEIAGSGNIEASVTDNLNVKVAGSGDVKYKGNPTIEKHIAGSGKLIKLD